MRSFRPAQLAPDLALATAGAGLTMLAAVGSTRAGATLSLGLLLGLVAFVLVVVAYVAVPHVAIAFTIPYFAALPMLKILVSSQLGATKDLVIIAAVVAAGILVVQGRAVRVGIGVDTPLVVMTLLLVVLYILDAGAGVTGGNRFGLGWFHGVRLVSEPLFLLLVGLVLKNPRRTLHWAIVALIATAFGAALIGLMQQAVGAARLVSLGYSYDTQVRTIGGHLRSFGPFDEPFDYATMLAFGLAGVLLWMRRGVVAAAALIVIGAGLTSSYVRGAALSTVALLAIVLGRKGHLAPALLLLGAAAVAGIAFLLASTQPTAARIVQTGPSTYLTLNGRTKSWRAALGKPTDWAFGRGVGLYGTAAERAAKSTGVPTTGAPAKTGATDSGYLATLSDVGSVGLLLMLVTFGRAFALLRRALARGEELAWVGIGILTLILLDAALRSSLTGFPTANVALLLVGVTLAATREQASARTERQSTPRYVRAP